MNEALATRQPEAVSIADYRKQRAEAIQRVLTQKTPIECISYKEGRGGKKMAYADSAYVIRTLNEAFAWDWDFEVLREEIYSVNNRPHEIRVLGQLTVRIDGQAIRKTQYGGMQIKFLKNSETPVSLTDDCKGAASNALRKCASLLGIALDLYDADDERTEILQEMKAIFLENGTTIEQWEDFFIKRKLALIKDNHELECILEELQNRQAKKQEVAQPQLATQRAAVSEPSIEIVAEVVGLEEQSLIEQEADERDSEIREIEQIWADCPVRHRQTKAIIPLSEYVADVLKLNTLYEMPNDKRKQFLNWLRKRYEATLAVQAQAPASTMTPAQFVEDVADDRPAWHREIDGWAMKTWYCSSELQERLVGMIREVADLCKGTEILKKEILKTSDPSRLSLDACKKLVIELEKALHQDA